MMKKIALAVCVALAVLAFVMISAESAEGSYRRSGIYISGGSVSFSFGSPSYGYSHIGGYPWRGRPYGRHGYYGRRHGGTSFHFSFGTGPRYGYYDKGYYGRPYYRRHRGYGSGYGYYPWRGRRTWVPGGMHNGRYRSGYWEYRDYLDDRDDRDEHRDRRRGRRGRGSGRY